MQYQIGLVWLLAALSSIASGQEEAKRLKGKWTIEQKLAQLFITVDSLYDDSYPYQPGFIIEGRSKDEANANESRGGRAALPILDVRQGIPDQLGLPFPQTIALQSITDTVWVDSLIHHTELYSQMLGYGGIFVTQPNLHLSTKLETQLYFSVDSPRVYTKIQVVPFPANILKQIHYREWEKVQINADKPHYPADFIGFRFGDENWLTGSAALEVSFEEMLHDKVLFYTSQFSTDHQKLVRIVKDRLMEVDLIHQRMDELIALKEKVHLVSDSVSLVQRQREQMVLRLAAMRQSTIAFERTPLLPINRVDSVSISVWDIRMSPDQTFMEKARFYHPGIDSLRQAKPTDLVLVLSDSPTQLELAVKGLPASSTGMGSRKILLAIGTNHFACKESILKQFDAVVIVHEKCPYEWCLLAQTLFGGCPLKDNTCFRSR